MKMSAKDGSPMLPCSLNAAILRTASSSLARRVTRSEGLRVSMLSVVLRYTGKGIRVGCWLTTRVICPSHELNDDDSLSGYKIKSCPLSAEYCECDAHQYCRKVRSMFEV